MKFHTSNKIRPLEVLFDGFHNPIPRNWPIARYIELAIRIRTPGLGRRPEDGRGDSEQLGSIPRQLEQRVVGLGVSIGRRRIAPRIASEIACFGARFRGIVSEMEKVWGERRVKKR